MDLTSLGITNEELIDRIVNKAAEVLIESEADVAVRIQQRVESKTRENIAKAVDDIGNRFVLPCIIAKIEDMVLQQTTSWGEKIGAPVTFREFLVQRAGEYMREKVDYQGKDEAECRLRHDTFRGAQSRIAHMVHEHLHRSIESAMKEALKTANAAIVGGLEKTVKLKLEEVAKSLSVSVKSN